MKRDDKLVIQILERLENEQSSRTFYEGETTWPDGDYEFVRPEWTDIEAYHIELMIDSGLLRRDVEEGEPWQSGGERDTYLSVTVAGHDYLDRARQNTMLRRLGRFASRFVDRAFASVVAPIIVSVFTVLVMRYFGLIGTGQ